jgi:hypothetical protein
MGFFTLYKAWFFDDGGKYVDTKWFPKHIEHFKYKDKSFIFKSDNPTYIEEKGLFWNTRFYLYPLNNPAPIVLGKKDKPIITSTDFNTILESELAKKLNDLSHGGLGKFLTMKNIIIGAVAIGVYFLIKSGKLGI